MTDVVVPTPEQQLPGQEQQGAAPAEGAQPGTVTESPNTAASTEQKSVQTEVQETTEQREQRERGRFQRRLDRHKEAKYRAEAEAKFWRERAAELEASRNQQQQPGNQEPRREDFEDYDKYLRAVSRYDAEQLLAEREKKSQGVSQQREQQARASSVHESVAKHWSEREKAFEATAKDYQVKVEAFLDEDAASLSGQARIAILESEVGPNLMYHLATHPDVVDRISALSPVRQVAELGKLEDKLSAQPAKQPSNAPPPAQVTGTGRSANGGYRENMSQAEFRAWAKSQGARLG